MRLATADRFHVSVDGAAFAGLKWTMVSGQELSREVPKMRAEAGGPQIPFPARAEISDITITKLYDSDTDGALFKNLMKENLYEGSTITVQELDQDGNAIPGAVIQYSGCVVKGVTRDDADANSQEPVNLTITWAVGSIA